jgi:NAD(P)-dependent dehydrogenase (short-subunit alcohol dehydrogenase family)
MMMDHLEGRSAVVTGPGSDIGRGIALGLAKEGVNVAIADIDEDFASETAEAVRKLGVRAISVQNDMSKRVGHAHHPPTHVNPRRRSQAAVAESGSTTK